MRLKSLELSAVSLLFSAVPAQAGTVAVLLRGTPWWVFVLFLYLLVGGFKASRPRVIAARRMILVPAIFIVWGLYGFLGRLGVNPLLGLAWGLAAATACGLAFLTVRLSGIEVDRAQGLVRLNGSWLPLARIAVIFSAKYLLTAATMINPDPHAPVAVMDAAVSGLAAGYFIGWLGRFYRIYRTEPAVALVLPSPNRSA